MVLAAVASSGPLGARADGNDGIQRALPLTVPSEITAQLDGAMPLESQPADPICNAGAGRWYRIDVAEDTTFRFGFRLARAGSILSFYVGSVDAPRYAGCLTHDPGHPGSESFRVAGPSALFVRASGPTQNTFGIMTSAPMPSGTVRFFVEHTAEAPVRPPPNELPVDATPIPALPSRVEAETYLSSTEARGCGADRPSSPDTLRLVPYKALWYELVVDEPTRVVAVANSGEGDIPDVTWFDAARMQPLACGHGGTDTEMHYGDIAHVAADLEPGVRYLLEVGSSAQYSSLWVDLFEAPVWDWGVGDVGLTQPGSPVSGRYVEGSMSGCHDGICHTSSIYVHVTVCSVSDPTRCTVDVEAESPPYGWDPYAAPFPECPGAWRITVHLHHAFGVDLNPANDEDSIVVDVPLEAADYSCPYFKAVSLLFDR